jgi:hypothetical protein
MNAKDSLKTDCALTEENGAWYSWAGGIKNHVSHNHSFKPATSPDNNSKKLYEPPIVSKLVITGTIISILDDKIILRFHKRWIAQVHRQALKFRFISIQ